jgi:hypothetical protein
MGRRRVFEFSVRSGHVSQYCVQTLWSQYHEAEHKHEQDFLTIFAPTTVAHAQAYSVLYDFGTCVGDPRNPSWPGVVAQDRDGNLYSTRAYGGVNGSGAMFKITPGWIPGGHLSWTAYGGFV